MGLTRKLIEGRWYSTPTEQGTGLLGAIERQFKYINGGQRGMGVTEQWLTRAVVRGLLETAGGMEQDGRFSLEILSDMSEKIEEIEQDVGGLKMLLAEMRALVPAPGFVQQIVDMQESLSARITALEQISPPNADDEPLFEDMASLLKRVEALEQVATTPDFTMSARAPARRGRPPKQDSATHEGEAVIEGT